MPATKVLLRSRIVERFASATDAPITAIIAPAGYGKSTALRQFLQHRRDPTILFGVRPDDDSLVAFARGLIQSSPALSRAALPTLQDAYTLAAQSADPGKVLADWLAIFVNDLQATVLIAIDDIQFGYADPRIPHFVTALIDQTKQRVRWLVSSRTWQHLPIDSWVAQGDMELPIDEVDLEFTADDVRELATLTSSARSPDAEILQHLTAQLGPIALVLALRTGIALDTLFHSSDSSEHGFSQLADRLFEALTEHERTFLKVASLLRSIDESLFLEAGVADVRELCERFADAGVLVPYGTDGSALRIHDLFAQHVERRLLEDNQHDSWCDVAKRLCLLLDERGQINPAIALCLKIHDPTLANDIVRRRGLMFWDHLNGELLDKTVALIQSDPEFKPDPVFRAVQGMHVFRSGNVAEGKRQLIAALTRITDPVTRSRIGARLTIGSMMSGAVPDGVQPFMFDVKKVDEAGALSEIAGALALVLGAKGKYQEVRDLIDRTIQRLSTMPGGDVAQLHFQQWAGFACWLVGDYEECRAFERRAVRDGIASGRPAVSVFGYTLLISIGLAFGDDLDELYQFAEDRREQERRAGYVEANGVSKLQALVCAVAAGDDATCSAIEHELESETSEITRIFVEQASKELSLRVHWRFAVDEVNNSLMRHPVGVQYLIDMSLMGRKENFALSLASNSMLKFSQCEGSSDIIDAAATRVYFNDPAAAGTNRKLYEGHELPERGILWVPDLADREFVLHQPVANVCRRLTHRLDKNMMAIVGNSRNVRMVDEYIDRFPVVKWGEHHWKGQMLRAQGADEAADRLAAILEAADEADADDQAKQLVAS